MIMATADPAGAHGLERLYQDYQRPILAYLLRLVGQRETAEDLCQETFVKALRGWAHRDSQANAAAWLYRIATNTAYDHLRRCRRVCFTPLLETTPTPNPTHAIEACLAESEPVRAALARLPLRYRVPLVLHTCLGHSLQEVATMLGCSEAAAKMRLFRARERFRKVYQGQG